MSAIFGVYHLDGQPASAAVLAGMGAVLAGRGPDATGRWTSGPVGLGHCALYTTPESLHEELPLALDGGRLAITADARLDNRPELVQALGIDESLAAAYGDNELILRAYQAWGDGCVARLLGDFAFAIWDEPHRRLLCARDHAGACPFYYYLSDRVFVFASEIKALFCMPDVPRRLNETVLADYLALMYEDERVSLYRDIWSLPTAHTLTLSPEGKYEGRYWSLDPRRDLRLSSDAEYAEAFREVFTEAVRCRLRSAYPVASMLSGGIDSSSIVAVAARLLGAEGRKLLTFSAAFPGMRKLDGRCDETDYSKAVAGSTGVDARYVVVEGVTPLMPFTWQEDEAIPAASGYMDAAIFEAAEREGVRVLFSGNDGDSVVYYGYEYLAELASGLRWRALLGEGRALAGRLRRSTRSVIWRYGLKPLVPPPLLWNWQRVQGRDPFTWDTRSMISPAFAARTRLADRVRAHIADFRLPRTTREGHYRALLGALSPWMLERLGLLARRNRIEMRYPFFDRRVMELTLSMPSNQKLRGGWNRFVMRRAMEGILPPEVCWRSGKSRLSANFNHRFLADERARLDEFVLHPGPIGEYLNMEAVKAAYTRYQAASVDESADSFALYWALVFGLWLQHSGLQP